MSIPVDRFDIRETALRAGADDCGVASAERFAGAPEGFRPTDIYSACKSVVVCVKQMPIGNIRPENPIPYTHAAYQMYAEMDGISMAMCRFFQEKGANAAIIPADVPYISWDEAAQHGRGILSLKHSAVQAGLGFMGRNTIFIHPRYGNMVYIGAVLVDRAIEPSPLAEGLGCPPGCSRCVEACPVGAIGGGTVDQKLCRAESFVKVGRGWDLYRCSRCRTVCRYQLGVK